MHSVTLQFATLEELAAAIGMFTGIGAPIQPQLELSFAVQPNVAAEVPRNPLPFPVELPQSENPFATVPPAIVAPHAEVDSAGLPWDHRIHGSTKSKNSDGTWRQKRGLEATGVNVSAVKEELRAAMAARAPESAAWEVPPAPYLPPNPIQRIPVPTPEEILNRAADMPMPTETFGTLMIKLAPKMAADSGLAAKLTEALAAFKLTALGQLAARPDLVPAFADSIKEILA